MQRWIKEEKCLGKVGKVQRGSKGSLTPFQRVSQSLAARKPCLWASKGSLQGFYRMFRVSTGCSVILLQDVSKWDVWGWMVDGRCMDGYGGRMGVWSDPRTDGWSGEMMWKADLHQRRCRQWKSKKVGLRGKRADGRWRNKLGDGGADLNEAQMNEEVMKVIEMPYTMLIQTNQWILANKPSPS